MAASLTDQPEIAVVIPAYNPGRYLFEAVTTALTQTVTNIEVVVVDDGSEDAKFPELPADQRLTVVRQSNSGVSVARNRGAKETSAPLIAFLDADDRWGPTKLERQLAAMADSESLLCYTGFSHIGPAGEQLGPGHVSEGSGYLSLLADCAIPMSSVVIRREALLDVGGFDPFYRIIQDWDLWLRLAPLGTFLGLPESLVEYRVAPHNKGQVSGDPWTAYVETRSVYDRHEIRAARVKNLAALDLISQGRRHARRLRSGQAASRFADSLGQGSDPEWEMLRVALRIDPQSALQTLAPRVARKVDRRFRRAASRQSSD